MRRLTLILLFICFTGSAFSQNADGMESSKEMVPPKFVLVFSKTAGYRHKSIEKGVATLRKLGRDNGFVVLQTETSEDFNPTNLTNYQCVVFLSTTQDVLNDKQQTAFENYIKGGGSFMGIHAATDTEYDWPWFGKLVGGYFNGHPNDPNVRDAKIDVLTTAHPATAHLGSTWQRTDEWYNYKNLNPKMKVLLNLDETSYEGGTNGKNHPIAWYHEFDGGRSFYTGGGHTEESFDEPDFQEHLLGGILWCLGVKQ